MPQSAPGCFWVFGLLCVSRWSTRVWVGSFHTPTTSATPLARDEGIFPGGLSSFQVPFSIFVSRISFLRCAPESLLVCSPIIETPATNLSSCEEAADSLGSTTFSWGCGCVGKSAEESAPCLVSNSVVFIWIPWEREKYKVNTGRAPYASVRLHTLGCLQVSQRLR